MIPILFEEGTTDFSNNGIGRLSACISCKVDEKESGVYECTFKYPVTGIHYSDIQEKRIIYTIHDDTKTKQPFEIYGRSAPHNGVVTFYAHHVSYLLGNVVLNPFTATSALEAMTRLKQNEINTSPFTFWTDKQVVADFEIKVPTVTRSILAGVEGSILDVYGGGDYEWDGYVVRLWADRGQDNNVNIRYGVNLLSMRQDTDDSSTFNAVCPFWRHEGTGEDDPDILVTLPEKIIRASSATSQTLRPVTLDLSDMWETAPDVQQLRDYSVAYMNQNLSWRMDESVEVNFVALWQTEDYKNVAPLQQVRIYDYVHIIYDELGINKKLQVVEVEYNVITERYDRMILGAAKPSFAEVVSGVVENNLGTNLASKSFVQQAVSLAADTIRGNRGGYKLEITDADGHTMETLYMDAPNVEDAVNILRIGMSGIAFSNHGYDPEEFVSAWDINGNFNANFIKTGILNANLIKAGIISDLAGKNFWNLETGEFSLQVVEGDSIDTAIKNAASSVAGYTLETPFTWSNNRQTANFTAVVYRGRTDVTAEFPDSWFVWTLRTEDGETQLGTGKTLSVNKSLFGYGATITCTFTTYETAALRSVAGKKLKSVSGKQMLMYAEQDVDIVVSDLPVKTSSEIELTDKLMGIDNVEGYQVSIQDFANRLATSVYDLRYYTQTEANNKYYTKTYINTNYYNKSDSDNRYYTKSDSDDRYYTKSDSDDRYYTKSEIGDLYYNKTTSDGRYVLKSGDTMTGNLTLPNANLNWSIDTSLDEARSGSQFGSGIYAYDGKNRNIFYNEMALVSDRIYRSYVVRGFDSSGAEVGRNGFYLVVMNDGTLDVRFTSNAARDAWANGLNVVKKAGDTMTGNLTIQRSSSGETGFYFNRTDTEISGFVGVGSGGTNHGVWSNKLNKWLIHGDASKVYVSGMDFTNAASVRSSIGAVNKAGDTITGKLTLSGGLSMTTSAHVANPPFYLTLTQSFDAGGAVGYVSKAEMKKNMIGWTQIAQVQGTNSVTYSLSGYTECLLIIWHGTNYFGTAVFPVGAIGSTQYEIYTGGWGNHNTGSNRAGCAKVSNTKLTGVMVRVDNTDVTSSSYFRLYAR